METPPDSSFIQEPNKQCIRYLDEIFPTPIWSFDLNLDIDSIKYWCYQEMGINPSRVLSNIGGWQSDDYSKSTNTPLSELKEYILRETSDIAKEIGIEDGERDISHLWININAKYCYNQIHIHAPAKLSGVFYVNVPENSGNICFTRMGGYSLRTVAPNSTIYSNAEWEYTPKNNRMIIFPAWQEHHVKANLSEEDRISISFNIN